MESFLKPSQKKDVLEIALMGLFKSPGFSSFLLPSQIILMFSFHQISFSVSISILKYLNLGLCKVTLIFHCKS
jgi:hypothetical protein